MPFKGEWSKIILITGIIALSGGCSKEASEPELYTTLKADGALRELRVNGGETVFYSTVHSGQDCMAADSALATYGGDFQLYRGTNVSQDFIINFHFCDLKNSLSQYNGVYYYSDLGSVSARTPVGELNYYRVDCPPASSVEFFYYDSGKLYKSLLAPNQNGSFFRITRSETTEHHTFGSCVLLEGVFSCKVYSASDDSLSLSEGEFRAIINNPD